MEPTGQRYYFGERYLTLIIPLKPSADYPKSSRYTIAITSSTIKPSTRTALANLSPATNMAWTTRDRKGYSTPTSSIVSTTSASIGARSWCETMPPTMYGLAL